MFKLGRFINGMLIASGLWFIGFSLMRIYLTRNMNDIYSAILGLWGVICFGNGIEGLDNND